MKDKDSNEISERPELELLAITAAIMLIISFIWFLAVI